MNIPSQEIIPQSTDLETRAYLGLWSAVFAMGVQDARSRHDKFWIHERRSYPGSFLWLCDLFNIDPDRARKEVLR